MADMTTEQIEQLEQTVMSNAGHIRKMDDFVSPEVLYVELINCVRKYHPSDDISMIEKAFRIANDAHEGQVRKSGEAYIIHPLCVAIILAELELDKETIVAGLLHDVVEDTIITDEGLRLEFSSEVALLVDGVTKLGRLSYDADKLEVQAENLEDVPCHGKGHPRHSDQACRPPAQHAYFKIYEAGETEGDCAGDDGHIRAHRAAAGYFKG